MQNFHSTPGHPRIPVAQRGNVAPDAPEPRPNMNMPSYMPSKDWSHPSQMMPHGAPSGGQIWGAMKPNVGPQGIDPGYSMSHDQLSELIGHLQMPQHAGMPQMKSQTENFGVGDPNAGALRPSYNSHPVAGSGPIQSPIYNGGGATGQQAPMTMAMLRDKLMQQNFGFGGGNPGAMRPMYSGV